MKRPWNRERYNANADALLAAIEAAHKTGSFDERYERDADFLYAFCCQIADEIGQARWAKAISDAQQMVAERAARQAEREKTK